MVKASDAIGTSTKHPAAALPATILGISMRKNAYATVEKLLRDGIANLWSSKILLFHSEHI